jgi:c-di-GMP-binding flagellar brake protein YcgR
MIMEKRSVLVANSADYHASIMTAIVAIRDDGSTVVFDYSGTKELDRLIGKSRSIHFSTRIDDIDFAFSANAVENTVYKARPAFSIQMPRSVHRVQRRDFYRASPPLSERPACLLEHAGNTYQATLIDISIGGLGALIPNADFKAGDVIERCRISTSIGIDIEASLKIVYVKKDRGGSGDTLYGCAFKNANALLESKLQKYVTYLQGIELAKRQELQSR